MKLISFVLSLFLIVGCGSSSNSTSSTSVLTEQEKTDLLILREEEKLARDVYLTLYDMYGQDIFSNIAQSEQTHTDAVLTLLNKYGVEDPVGNNDIGVFENTTLQELYDALIAQGSPSKLDALIVGATIEDLDIYDIEVMMSHTTKEDLLLVYDSLQQGSRNHLRSFVSQIESSGGTYTPQYISQAEYDAIIGSDIESGN